MSKSLETEYKNAVLNDLPDLWSRIEASLPDIQNKNNTNCSDKEATDTIQKDDYSKKVDKKKKKIKPWLFAVVPMAAAGICVVIPLAILGITQNSTKADSGQAFSATFCNDVVYDSADAEEACCETTESEYIDAVSENTYEAFETDASNTKDIELENGIEESVKTDDSVSESENEEKDTVVAENVIISVIDIWQNEDGINVAKIKITGDISANEDVILSEEDGIIEAIVDNEEELAKDGEYTVTIGIDAEGNYTVIVNN